MTGASLEDVDERVVEGVQGPVARDRHLDAMPGPRVVDGDHHVVARRAPEQRDPQAVGAADGELAPRRSVGELPEVDDPAAGPGRARSAAGASSRAGSQRQAASAATTAQPAATAKPMPIASVNARAAASLTWLPAPAGMVAATAFARPIESSTAVRAASGTVATESATFEAYSELTSEPMTAVPSAPPTWRVTSFTAAPTPALDSGIAPLTDAVARP